jgi:hypothetical protein
MKNKKTDFLTMVEEEEFNKNHPNQAIGIPPCKGGILIRASINVDMNSGTTYKRQP